MTLFSQRIGYRPLSKAIQRESIDVDLKNGLWNALQIAIWSNWYEPDQFGNNYAETNIVEQLIDTIWLKYFKLPLDEKPLYHRFHNSRIYNKFRVHFYNGEWWETYDFLEFILKNAEQDWSIHLNIIVNKYLEEENAAYRIIENEIVEITDENEIDAIEEAISSKVETVAQHMHRALEMISDKSDPDYRNSIKESISAVEAMCQYVVDDDNAMVETTKTGPLEKLVWVT